MSSWLCTAGLGALAVLFLTANLLILGSNARHGTSASLIPLAAGLFGLLACLFCPLPSVRPWAPVALLVDITWPALLWAVVVDRAFSGPEDPG